MLHHILLLRKVLPVIFLFGFLIWLGCKKDASTHSEEEQAYMADYEPAAHKWGFIDTEGNLVIDAGFDDVGPFSEGLASVSKGGKWGFINRKGELVIQPVFKSAWTFHEGRARVQVFDQPDQFIDISGTPLKAEDWSAADDFSDGRARVKVGNSYGYVDSSGHLVIQPLYSRGWNFSNGLCIVEYQEKQAVINKEGKNILSPEYDQVKFSGDERILLCRKGNEAIAFDVTGKELLRIADAKMVDCDGDAVSVRKGNEMYLVSLLNVSGDGSTIYSNIIYLEEKLWAGKTNNGYVLMDNKGIPVTATAYNQINKFSNDVAAYSKGEYWGYLDKSGKELTGDVFGLAWDYKDGYARAAFKDGIAFIDKNQKLAFYPPRGSLDMRDFSEGLASVQID